MAIKICPKCNGKVSTSRNLCIHCGYVFPTLKRCPDCGELVDVASKECLICGYPFEELDVADPVTIAGENDITKKDSNDAECNNDNVNSIENKKNVLEETPVIEKNDLNLTSSFESNNDDINEGEIIEKKDNNYIECPYCHATDFIEIGINFYACNVCKGKYPSANKNDLTDAKKEMD